MADFVEVMRIKHRICNAANDCENCILSTAECICAMLDSDDYEGMEEKILAWAAEHPAPRKKTRAEVFLEKFPHAKLDANACPDVCAAGVFNFACTQEDCKKCWNRPAPDEYQEGETK